MVKRKPIKADPFFTWDLLSWFSHRFSSSCHVSLGFSELLEETDGLTEDQRDMVKNIKSNIEDMEKNLAEIGKIVKGVTKKGYRVPVSEFNLFETIDYGVREFLPPSKESADFIKEYGVKVREKIPITYRGRPYRERSGRSIVVIGHEDLSGLALVNLFSNAAKYGKTKIDVDVRKKGEHVETVISNDCDVGIPDEYLEKVFEPYSKVPGNENSGQGIGLYLSRRMARAQGGDVWLESEGNIVRAYFRLPSPQK